MKHTQINHNAFTNNSDHKFTNTVRTIQNLLIHCANTAVLINKVNTMYSLHVQPTNDSENLCAVKIDNQCTVTANYSSETKLIVFRENCNHSDHNCSQYLRVHNILLYVDRPIILILHDVTTQIFICFASGNSVNATIT